MARRSRETLKSAPASVFDLEKFEARRGASDQSNSQWFSCGRTAQVRL